MNSPIKILHLEDNDLDAELVRSQLEKEGFNFQLYRACNKEEFLSRIKESDFNFIISDFSLPDYDGLSALKLVRQTMPEVPFVFISATLGEDRAIQSMRHGATDYVAKDKIEKLGLTLKRIIDEQELKLEKHKAEKASKESMKLYKTLVETQPAGISMTDLQGKVLYTSKKLARMHGYDKPEEMIGINFLDLFCEEDRERALADFKQTHINGGASDLIYKVKRKDGSAFISSRSVSLLKDDNGNPKAIICASTDITGLIKAKEQAEEMNRLKNHFLSNMSHELRTPLISIIGFSELLQEEIENPGQKEMLNHIYEGGQRLNNTLNSILEISKLETSASFENLTRHNLADEITKSVQSLKPMVQRKRLFIKTELNDTFLEANVDSELLGKAFFHLISNAVKFTKTGGIFVTLNQHQVQENHWAVIKVIDTGIGIPKENLEKIFVEFRQSSEGYSRSHEGTGLGLSISKKIIELMKGKIEVESEVGNPPAGKAGGSVFSIWLPAILNEKQIASGIENKLRTTVIEPMTKMERSRHLLLLVEDNPSNRYLMIRMLGDDFQVIEAEDGLTGISLASKKLFDLILMDINLGAGIDGVETMHQVRKIPGYARVPIIAVTAFVMSGDKERFLDEGFDSYLAKPFSRDSLNELVGSFLRRSSRQ